MENEQREKRRQRRNTAHEQSQENGTVLGKGLSNDTSYQAQSEGTHRFALNAIIETDQGDFQFLSNEESNEECAFLKDGYTPIGKVYIGDDKIAVFSVKGKISEIGIYKPNICEYEVHVNDEFVPDGNRIGFSINNPIEATYRLRRGCEDTIYWVDNLNRPRYYNFQKSQDFKDNLGHWKNVLFNLQKTYNSIPFWAGLEVENSGGQLLSGSYNFAIQYIDQSLNPTEWITSSPTVKIYNDSTNNNYLDIAGSVNSDIQALNFPASTKAIRVNVSNLDQNYEYWRLAIICSNNGSGLVNDVYYTEEIPIKKTSFLYTGVNHQTKGLLEEINAPADIVERAKAIEQIDNMLLLGNTAGSSGELCELQKYASKIMADVVTKEVILNSINDPANSKNPTYEFNGGLGYMPGEIYSFGIVYVFNDMSLSPAFHIPGKRKEDENIVFSSLANMYPMSTDNEGESVYVENTSCGNGSYWGDDYKGFPLAGQNIRHHRFPLRRKLKKPLVTTESSSGGEINLYTLCVTIKGKLKVPVPCPEDTPNCGTDLVETIALKIKFIAGDGVQELFMNIDPNEYADGENNLIDFEEKFCSSVFHSDMITDITLEHLDNVSVYGLLDSWSTLPTGTVSHTITSNAPHSFDFKFETTNDIEKTGSKIWKNEMFGIHFSNIELPKIGKPVIGYYIVRNERTQEQKTILDSASLIRTRNGEPSYSAHGLLHDEGGSGVNTRLFGVIHPEHKFNDKEILSYTKIIQEGEFIPLGSDTKCRGILNYDDVKDGTTYDSKAHKEKKQDDAYETGSHALDGWSMNVLSRDHEIYFRFDPKGHKDIVDTDIDERFYLEALGERQTDKNGKYRQICNIACDNKVGFVLLKNSWNTPNGKWYSPYIPYVLLYRENKDPYSTFRTLPYYKQTVNPIMFGSNVVSETSAFSGDVVTSPMRYVNALFYADREAKRKEKGQAWKFIVAGVMAAAAVVAAVITAGAATPLALYLGGGAVAVLTGAGVGFLSSGVKGTKINKMLNDEYEKGLRKSTLDEWVDDVYNYKGGWFTNGAPGSAPPPSKFGFAPTPGIKKNDKCKGEDGPSDDTIQWIGEALTNLWFEGTVNINLRNGFADDSTPSYMPAPNVVQKGQSSPINTWRVKFNLGTSIMEYVDSGEVRHAVSAFEKHLERKFLVVDQSRDDWRKYIGFVLSEYYGYNLDYSRYNLQKPFFHLPLEYDCCAECNESFPHRIYYSQQSHQEELTDNYRVFLPNNYRDIEGETGEIVNLYRWKTDLYIHTREGFWQQPRNFQERVTDQIVSFIGTGEYFNLPPMKITGDDNGLSAGISHKWSALKTQHGIFFVSGNENKIHLFAGRTNEGLGLNAISNAGLNNWFKKHIPVKVDNDYFKIVRKKYPFMDNPYHPLGTGFISVYDSRKERVIFTKKDLGIAFSEDENDIEICFADGVLYKFLNYQQTIDEKEQDGWTFMGIENCRMKFSKPKTILIPFNPQVYHEDKDIPKSLVPVGTRPIKQYIYSYVDGVPANYEILNNSWTISFSLKTQSWTSWHSYLPNFYMHIPDDFFSWIHGNNNFFKHNKLGNYQSFYNKHFPFIVEYVSLSNPMQSRTWEFIRLLTEAKRYDALNDYFYDERFITFNKAILYNTRQISGLLNLTVKDTQTPPVDYLEQQTQNTSSSDIIIDRNERDWQINHLRDLAQNYGSEPMFKQDYVSLQPEYYIDKVINPLAINLTKDWFDRALFRDKYLVVRLIFDKHRDVKLLLNYSIETELTSQR